jgi:hypothetical protein
MIRKALLAFASLTFAFAILLVSLMRSAAVRYEFGDVVGSQVMGTNDVLIDYNLAYPGRVLPDSFLWPVKALRDKIWLLITTNKSKKAELKLLFADKRIGMAKILFEKGNPEEGFSVLTKAEKYLEEAGWQEEENRKMGIETMEFNRQMLMASLKHYLVMQEILEIAPEDAKPKIIQASEYPKRIYFRSKNNILEEGGAEPINPFDWR